LAEEVKNAKVSEDSEILQLAQELLKKINSDGRRSGGTSLLTKIFEFGRLIFCCAF
jgi:hypothetical protein